MSQEILSVAVFDPHPGQEGECLAALRELFEVLHSKRYSRDLLYRDTEDSRRYILVRYWTSEAARQQAHEDPAVLKCWERLGNLVTTIKVYEKLEEIPL